MESGTKTKLYQFRALPEEITRVRDRIGQELKDSACPDLMVNRVMFIFEELFLLIHDCNPGKAVHAECAVEIGETVRLITKDDGRIVDLMDTDHHVASLRAYALSNMIENHVIKRVHSLALSYNHNALEIQ